MNIVVAASASIVITIALANVVMCDAEQMISFKVFKQLHVTTE